MSNWLLLTATLLVAGTPQKPAPKLQPKLIDTPTIGVWKKSSLKPAVMISKTSGAIKGMKGIGGVFDANVLTSGGTGRILGLIRVNDQKHYRIDYFVHDYEPFSVSMVNDGNQRKIRKDGEMLPPIPSAQKLASSKLSPSLYTKQFFTDFSKLAFQGLTEGVDAWGPIISGFLSPKSGFTTVIEERILTMNGRKITNYRLKGSRSPAMAKKLGKASFEIRFDGNWWLPVTIRTEWIDGEKRPWAAQWAAHYGRPAKPFSPAELLLSAPVVAPK